ncbi:siderophore ABC transporter substrate-binding protein [Prauserella oleivorans]|uniref:Siderophore ABC transporter substrate-binding protein n=1 Tax=Prauserella oleivorans TaxID=1478153 RepID=A0ABW5WD47_9PSEU
MRHASTRRRWLTALGAGGLLLALSACSGAADSQTSEGPGPTVTVQHAQGTATIEGIPEKIVVFDLGVLTTLDDLGVDGVVGVPEVASMPKNLTKYAGDEYTKVGSLKEPDYEQVNELAPDLILVAGRSAPAYGELSKIATTVDLTVDSERFLDSAKERVVTLGKLFGKQSQARQRLDALTTKAAEVAAAQPATGKRGLVVLTTGGKMSAYGPGSRFGIVYDALGVQPAVPNLSAETHGDAISAEFIADANPDVLYVIDRDSAIGEQGQAARQLLDNQLVNGTNAAKNGKIVYLDPATWYLASNGLSSLEAMVDEIGASLK